MKKKVILYSIFLFLIDQITKFLFDKLLVLNKPLRVFEKFLYLTKSYNTGVSFSMLKNAGILIILLSLVILVFLWRYQKSFEENERNIIAFSLVYGGLIGNLVDRIVRGHVVDFLDFYIFNLDFPIFNFADICICCGVGFLLYAIYKGEDNENSSRRSK